MKRYFKNKKKNMFMILRLEKPGWEGYEYTAEGKPMAWREYRGQSNPPIESYWKEITEDDYEEDFILRNL